MIAFEINEGTAVFDRKTGQIVSYIKNNRELLENTPEDPVFRIEFLDKGQFVYLDSTQANEICYSAQGGSHCWTYCFAEGLRVLSYVGMEDGALHFRLALENGPQHKICQIQYPWIIVPYGGEGHVLQPYNIGYLFDDPQPQDFKPDSPRTWQFEERNGTFNHYTGRTFAQFMAYYGGDGSGLVVMAQDSEGYVKQIMPVAAKTGVRLGFSHVGDWSGNRRLEYDICLRDFQGDWYDGAQVYRAWSDRQPWARPLYKRQDLPKWMTDSPTFLMIRLQGALDAGPATVNQGFLPYERLSRKIARFNEQAPGPVLPVLMAWEKGGPWVYPDCFPPVGGAREMELFAREQNGRGNHAGTYSNGTRWVMAHDWNGYDGTKYFEEQHGEETVCMTKDGTPWKQDWDQEWRPSYTGCMNVERTQEIAVDYIKTMIENGIDWIQFLDQNNGCSVFPCFSEKHGHENMPGRWMTQSLEKLFGKMAELKEQVYGESGREIVYSVEGPSCEYFIPCLDICDSRVNPRGNPNIEANQVPLYQFLYHDYILLNGGFGYGPEPYHLEIKNALNLVTGQIPGAVLMDDGALQNRDTDNWAPWDAQPGSQAAAIGMLNTVNTMRRCVASDWLVYGKMQRPAELLETEMVQWRYGKRYNELPAVFHSVWSAPDGRTAAVLANWTGKEQWVKIADARIDRGTITAVCGRDTWQCEEQERTCVPALGAVLIEQENTK